MSKDNRKVYIIESLSQRDVLDNRNEGIALSEALSLAQIKNCIYRVTSLDMLIEAMGRIVTDINRTENKLGLVDLHFSMHGNNDGIAFTNNDFVSWEALFPVLKWFNDKVGYMDAPWSPGRKYSPANLNFSVCEGFSARILKEYCEESPFTSILGPVHPVSWTDSLVAFSVYYHHTINKGTHWKTAAKIMNIAAGLKDVFQLEVAYGLNREDIAPDLLQLALGK